MKKTTEFIWRPYLPAGSLTLLTGTAGSGKSAIAKAIAETVLSGRPLAGRDVLSGDILVYGGCRGTYSITRAEARTGSILGVRRSTGSMPVTDIGKEAAKVRNLRLIAVDPVQSVLADWDTVDPWRYLVDLARELNVAVLATATLGVDSFGGALALATMGELRLMRATQAGKAFELEGALPKVPPLSYRLEDGQVVWLGNVPDGEVKGPRKARIPTYWKRRGVGAS